LGLTVRYSAAGLGLTVRYSAVGLGLTYRSTKASTVTSKLRIRGLDVTHLGE